MNKKAASVLIGFVIFMLIATSSLLVLSQTKTYTESPTSPESDQNDSFTPTVRKPAWIDHDNNGIADSLDQEIADRIANDTARDYVNITVMLKAAPTTGDVEDFVSCGGYLTTDLWTEATYGFGGTIKYDAIENFTQRCPDVLLVEKEAVSKATVAYAAQQVGARTYVWNTLGLQGDPNSSIAVLDSGIDGSHVDFSPGYGDQDFSKKIVGWNDQIGSASSPVDEDGHGSHCAGLAAGDGFFSVDASGNAVATYGSELSGGGTWFGGGMMVNKTGIITINVKWMGTGTAKLSSAVLRYGDKNLNYGSWTTVSSVSTPNPNTFYSITYNVASIPSGGYDMYHIMLPTTGTGDLYVTYNVSWPYTPPADGFSAWTGISPQSKLVGVRVFPGTNNDFIGGIEWIIAHRMTYHITVVSISLNFGAELPGVDTAILNLVNSGITTVIAAGNYEAGGNYIYSPSSVDEAMTVASMNQFDNIASYSSQGGTSRSTGKTTKPDITAPGGSHYASPLFSADSNANDGEGGFAEIQPNDAAPMQGTSMAAPIISGCAQVVIQAMGGYATWNWTRSQALQPKMILLMTATETYPDLREGETPSTSPTLERGGKDIHEGYGRVNLDAAVDAILGSYGPGSVATDTLGTPPTTTDISVLGQRLAWARNVQLVSGSIYNFSLSVPAGADYDLYLYNSTGTTYGEPAIVAQSTNATTGGIEQFWVTAPYTGTYYIVVKRATETTGSGTFTLASSGPGTVDVTLNTPGLPSAPGVVHYVQNGVAKTGSIVASTFSDYADLGTTLTIDNPIYVSDTQRYITTDSTSFTIQSVATFTVNYNTQYYITVNSDHDAPTASQWVDQGGNFAASVTSPTEVTPNDHQWVCTGYSLDGGSSQSGSSYTFTNVQAAHTIVFNWNEQFYLTVNSAYGSPAGDGWYDSGTTANAVLSSGTVSGGTGVQYVFTGWSDDASGTGLTSDAITMNSAKTATANWKTQYYLTVSSAYGAADGEGWYDFGAAASAIVTPLTVAGDAGTQYVFTGWSGDASGATSPSDAIIMSSPKTATANWKTQYRLTVSSAYGTVGGEDWYDSGASAYANVSPLTVAGDTGTQYVFAGWSGDASGTDSTSDAITMSGPKTAIADWKTRYYLTTSTNFGSVNPESGWHDAGSTVTISATTPSAGSGERYVWNSWTGTGSGSYAGTDNQASVTMNGAVTEVASWTHQYYLTVSSPYGSPTPVSGWFDAGTSMSASVNSPAAGSIVTEYVCTGWTGTGSVPASGTANSISFTIDQPSSITWTWKTEYLITNLLVIIIVPVAVAGLAVYLLLRRRHKGKSAGGAPEPTLLPPPPPPAAQRRRTPNEHI